MIFIVRRPQYFISHTTSQWSLVMRYRLARVIGNRNVSLGRLWLLRCLIPFLDGLSLISLNDHVNFIFNVCVIHGELVPSVRRNLSFETIHVVSPLASTGYSQTEVLSSLSKHGGVPTDNAKNVFWMSAMYIVVGDNFVWVITRPSAWWTGLRIQCKEDMSNLSVNPTPSGFDRKSARYNFTPLLLVDV